MKTAESTASNPEMSTARTQISRIPDDAVEVDFHGEREQRPDIWQTALEHSVEISEAGRPDLFLVDASGEIPANCSLAEREDGHVGWCSCPQFAEHGVCLDLCAIRQAAVIDDVSIPSIARD